MAYFMRENSGCEIQQPQVYAATVERLSSGTRNVRKASGKLEFYDDDSRVGFDLIEHSRKIESRRQLRAQFRKRHAGVADRQFFAMHDSVCNLRTTEGE